jgi:hypothetical protein
LKGDHPRTIPAKFALIWFSGFRGEDFDEIWVCLYLHPSLIKAIVVVLRDFGMNWKRRNLITSLIINKII